MSAWAVILCGGSSTRMGAGENKTLLKVGGVPAVIRCIRAFRQLTEGIVLVVKSGEEDAFSSLLSRWHEPVSAIVPGGYDRQASALCGLTELPACCEIALIHDGARLFVSASIISRVLESVKEKGSGVAAVPARDTIKRTNPDGLVLETPDRASLWQVQTPQGFRLQDMLAAHKKANQRYTDDAALMEAAGFPVQLVMGGYDNLKLTSPEDLKMTAGMLLPRIGTGFDAHRLTEGRELWLGGVHIPYEKGLLGHSDADAALHALTDALLGAASMGDIGKLFPDNDDRYKGISSRILLEEAARRIREKDFEIGNCDITILAQAPKLAPYIDDMRRSIAASLRIPVENVSVKASTTEKMGYEGRGEGISAQAAALIFQKI